MPFVSAILRTLFLMIIPLALTSCAGAGEPTASDNANVIVPTALPLQANVAPTDASGQPVAAIVNGESISLSTLDRAFQRAQQQQLVAADPITLRADVLNTLIEQALVSQEAARQAVNVSDAEIDGELQGNIELAGGAEGWANWLNTNLYTEAEYRDALRVTLVYSRMIERVTSDLNGDVPQVRARHILVNSETEATDILQQLQIGADFAALAAERSLDATTRENSGDLGWFTQDELIDPALGTIAFSLEPNQIAGPIQTTLGYHIIQTLERANRPLPEDRRAQVAQRQFETWLASLVASASIQRFI